MKLKDIIAEIDDLLPKTDMHYGLIRRKLQDGTIKVINFSPSALFSKDLSSPIHLEKEDAVYFFSIDQSRNNLINGIIDDLRRQRTLESLGSIISVSGLVRFPGQYPLTENMTLTDLLYASGGLLDAAYSVSAEITRMTVDGSRIASIDHIIISDFSESNHSNTVFFEPYDHLHIKRVPYWSENQTVSLSGEFLFSWYLQNF